MIGQEEFLAFYASNKIRWLIPNASPITMHLSVSLTDSLQGVEVAEDSWVLTQACMSKEGVILDVKL